jgi:hypothetical protein
MAMSDEGWGMRDENKQKADDYSALFARFSSLTTHPS